jgi:hypothetical protein
VGVVQALECQANEEAGGVGAPVAAQLFAKKGTPALSVAEEEDFVQIEGGERVEAAALAQVSVEQAEQAGEKDVALPGV